MSSALEIYQRHLRQQLVPKGFAVWPPGRTLQLGDVVIPGRAGDLRKQTDLRQLGIELRVDEGKAQPISATSERLHEAAAQASGGVQAVAKGALDLMLREKGSTIFEVQGFQHLQISNLAEIGQRILELYDKGNGPWKAQWCIVDQLWWVAAGTIIVAATDNVAVKVSAEGSDEVPLLTVLANPELNVRVDVQGDQAVKVIGGRDFPAMFTCSRLNFFKTDLKPISTGGAEPDEEPQLVRLTLDDIEAAWRESASPG